MAPSRGSAATLCACEELGYAGFAFEALAKIYRLGRRRVHNQDSPRPKEKDKSGGHGWGLRRKSLLALAAACLIALIPAALVGWQAIQASAKIFGLAYARNLNELSRQRILAPVSRELALALRLAESEALRQWLEDENNPDKRAVFFERLKAFATLFAIIRGSSG